MTLTLCLLGFIKLLLHQTLGQPPLGSQPSLAHYLAGLSGYWRPLLPVERMLLSWAQGWFFSLSLQQD